MERKETLYQLKETKHAESMSVLSAIAERERIGRDLHDVAGHALSSIALKAQLADKLLSKNQVKLAQQEVKALAQLSQALLSDIRHAVSNIKHLSLQQEVAKNVALLEENHFNVAFSISNNVETLLTSAQETQLALILKELTTNTLRHSHGHNVTLDISCRDKNVMLRYCDLGADGVSNGNDGARSAQGKINAKKLNEGNGLTGIRERAELISASVKFQCNSNAAFSCEVSLPII
jgi:two-component system sensor histidine kinase DesK